MLEMYVTDSMVTLEEHRHMADDRNHNCQRSYKYNKCKVCHKQKCHNLFTDDELTSEKDEKTSADSEDHNFNYAGHHLSLGLLLCNAEDSVKVGDGDRHMIVWNSSHLSICWKEPISMSWLVCVLRPQSLVF